MAVYDLRDKNSGVNPWNYLLAKGAGGLLDNFIDGMFKRDAEAREIRRNKGLYEDMVQAGSPQYETVEAPGTNVYFPQEENDYGAWNGALDAAGVGSQPMGGLWDTTRQTTRQVPGTGMTRENMMKVFAKRGASSDQVKSLSDLYMNQFETADKLGYQDAVAGRVGGLDYDVRSNPQQAMQNGMTAQAYGLKPEGLMAYAYPNYENGNFSAGDREVQYSFDPRTGAFSTQEYGYGIDPTKRYQSDADTEQANISAGAQRYVADRNYAGKWVPSYKEIYGPNGEVQAFNTKDGSVADTGAKSYPRGQGAGTKPLTPQQRLSLGQAAVRSTEQMGTPEEKWNYIVRMSQGDSAAIDAMARAVFAYGQIPPEAEEFFKTGNVRQAGQGGQPAAQEAGAPVNAPSSVMQSSVVAEARSRFPNETRGLTDEQVMAKLMQYK